MLAKIKQTSSKKNTKNIVFGIVHINATFNNTIVTISDLQGNTISWASAGSVGFKGARKGTPFAAQTAAEKAASLALPFGLKKVEVLLEIFELIFSVWITSNAALNTSKLSSSFGLNLGSFSKDHSVKPV